MQENKILELCFRDRTEIDEGEGNRGLVRLETRAKGLEIMKGQLQICYSSHCMSFLPLHEVFK